MNKPKIRMITSRFDMLGGVVHIEGTDVSVQPFYVATDVTPAERSELLIERAEQAYLRTQSKGE